MDHMNDEPSQVIKAFCSPSTSPSHGEHSMTIADDDASDLIDNNSHSMSVVICANELEGHTFLMDPREDGQHHHACIIYFIQDHEHDLKLSDDHHKFRISINDDEYEEIIMYNILMHFIEKNKENDDIVWRFKHIIGHQGPLICTDPNYKGSKYNVLMGWENGEITKEPLAIIAADDPVTYLCHLFKEKGLLDKEGWKHFKKIAD
jgi:hypothetical protein